MDVTCTVDLQVNSITLRTRAIVGLNQSVIAAAAFDQDIPQRLYAVTTSLDLLMLHMPDKKARDVQVSFLCMWTHKSWSHFSLSLQLLFGYLHFQSIYAVVAPQISLLLLL